jgi:hypothetical protein
MSLPATVTPLRRGRADERRRRSRRLAAAALVILPLAACRDTTEPPVPTQIVAHAGAAQSAEVTATLDQELVVKVQDDRGRGVRNVAVSWHVSEGGGSLEVLSAETDRSGLARASWTLGMQAVENRAHAVVTDLGTVQFTATALPGALDRVQISPRTPVLSGVADTTRLYAATMDRYGNAVGDVVVGWSALDPDIVSVDGAGLTRAVAAGTARVTASAGGRADTIQVSVVTAPNVRIAGAYLTQVTQRFDGAVPLVAGREAYLRVFVTTDHANSATPDVRVRLFHGGTPVDTRTIAATRSSVPQSVDESTLQGSWNALVPAELIRPGLAMLVELDPDGSLQDDPSDNVFPLDGMPLPIDVRDVPLFRGRFVPILQAPNGLIGGVTADNYEAFLVVARRLFPILEYDVDVRSPYTVQYEIGSSYDTGKWWDALLEIRALQIAEGDGRYYYGVFKPNYSFGGTGYALLNARAAIGVDWMNLAAQTVAHEWGHNFGLYHAPCGNPDGVDPNYPYAGGIVGQYGFDLATLTLRPRTYTDLQGYCDRSTQWLSDYHYRRVLNHRQQVGSGATGTAGNALLVWGRIGDDGLVLEPSFELRAPASLPEGVGPYRVEGLDADGRRLFSLAFAGERLAHADGDERIFAFAVPLGPQDIERLVTLRLVARGRAVTRTASLGGAAAAGRRDRVAAGARVERAGSRGLRVGWDAGEAPAVMIRDAGTGEILSFARGGTAGLLTDARELELVFSDGVRSFRRRVPAPR